MNHTAHPAYAHAFISSVCLLLSSTPAARAEVTPNPLFADHAVLQQSMTVPIWGTADPGETVTVEIGHQTVSTAAGPEGKWLVHLAPLKAGGPFTLTISGKNKIVLRDILVGEVWLAGGQSNMERQLGPRVGQKPIFNWEKEVAAASHPQIRQFGVAQTKSFAPLSSVKGQWAVCTPETVKDFTAVGYFFGRDLQQARHVPIGLIHSSWGGTPAEAWTSEDGLRKLPDFADTLEQLKLVITDPAAAQRQYEARMETWFRARDVGSAPGHLWSDPALDSTSWKVMTLPTLWEDAGEPDLNGVVWFRKTFELPASAAKAAAELQLGMIDDIDTTWVNGVKVGATTGYNLVRKYAVPAGVLKPGHNVVAVRVLDTGGGGGIWGDEKLRLIFKGTTSLQPIELSGPWQYRIGMTLQGGTLPPMGVSGDVNTPTVLYNGMIAPLVPYAMRGVIWYQGEANVYREEQYRTLFPAMIADWRRAWGEGEFPFLFVQIAPFRDMTPEIREAQLLSWQHTSKTAMVVTTDCGDANDIHPTHKQPVGARLALAARALAYGERLEYSGPIFDSITVKGDKATLRFTHLEGGLVAKGGPLKGFTIAGADNGFHPGKAEIRGKTVVVTSKTVPRPMAVRYGWANVPEGNLFSKAGLPASPFRTDGPESKTAARYQDWAATPPMGWNSWDAYGTAVREQDVKANADYMAEHLAKLGWQYIVVDIQWYEPNAKGHDYDPKAKLALDAYGRLLPAPNRFPSAADGVGFKALADYVHGKGLKFGIHIMRGIPRQAVTENLPIKGTKLHARDIADEDNHCRWNPDMWGIDTTRPGSQQYYDSIAELYASWGVDFIKADDLGSHLFQPAEMQALHRAIVKTGRPMVLSISPGPAPVLEAETFQKNAQMWRISDDFWDEWKLLRQQFEFARDWVPEIGKNNTWPDADMLALGRLRVSDTGGKGEPSKFTPDEQRTMMTLWSIMRSPLIFGGDLPSNDAFTLSLISNPEVIAVDQHSLNNRQALAKGGFVAWTADAPGGNDKYLAVFNLGDSAGTLEAAWSEFGLTAKNYGMRDLWRWEDVGNVARPKIKVSSHASALFRLSPSISR